MAISERFCCCLDVATGSLLAGIYTSILSLAFLAMGIDSLVETSRDTLNRTDSLTLNAVYGLLIALSLLFGISSVSLVLGASRKFKTYVISWLIVSPLWTILAFCVLIILPLEMSHAVTLTSFSSRVAGTVIVMTLNIFSMICVSIFMMTLLKSPVQKLRSLGVVEALETGFSNGYSRLRESIRPSKSKGRANFKNSKSSTENATVSIPDIKVSVVLDPNKLEVVPSERRAQTRRSDEERSSVGSENWRQSLSQSDELDSSQHPTGLSNPGFSFTD